ncbi:MAG: hypothetical protein NXI32_07945 [bacterium]|nr:hypothetical protein [bacterium]
MTCLSTSKASLPQSLFRSVILLAGLSLCGGCSSWLPEMEPFGAVSGVDVNRSLNGLGVHREMWESAGVRCVYPQKLSPRLESLEVIVLVGKSYDPPGKAARRWLEAWLARQPGRSVIYFGRDFNAGEYYRRKTLDRLSGPELMQGRRELAALQAEELNLRIQRVPEGTFCGWFFMDVMSGPLDSSAEDLQGPWSEQLTGLTGTWPLRTTLWPPADKWRQQKPSWITSPPPADPLRPVDVGSDEPEEDPESPMQRSVWRVRELSTDEAWETAFEDSLQARVLLQSPEGRPYIFQLTDLERFPESQLIIVANGAPLLNASLVETLHRQIGARIVESCLPAKRVALLSYDEDGLLISNLPEPDARGAGLEMLTVWPLSGVTMPAALLGIIVCAALFPVLGRARKLATRKVSDFGLHVEAMGRMLQDSGDVEYAKQVIRDYYAKVKQESPPYWLSPIEAKSEPKPAMQRTATTANSPEPAAPTKVPEAANDSKESLTD